jgi:hypothetical protein
MGQGETEVVYDRRLLAVAMDSWEDYLLQLVEVSALESSNPGRAYLGS